MMTLGSFVRNSASSPAVIRTSVMAGLSCFMVAGWGRSEIPLVLVAGQHLAKLLGGGGDDGDEIGFAQPALGTVALQVAARAAMEHRRMRSRAPRKGAPPQPQPRHWRRRAAGEAPRHDANSCRRNCRDRMPAPSSPSRT